MMFEVVECEKGKESRQALSSVWYGVHRRGAPEPKLASTNCLSSCLACGGALEVVVWFRLQCWFRAGWKKIAFFRRQPAGQLLNVA